jgi:DNA polymerase elongation subunit (family B)
MSKRSELIESEFESNLFFIYDAADSTNNKNEYILQLYAVKLDGTKIKVNVLISDIFFDIRLHDSNLIDSYVEEFLPDSYEVIEKQPFDSGKKHEFLRLYFQNHRNRKKALDNMIQKKEEMFEELNRIDLDRKGKLKDEDSKVIRTDKKVLDIQEMQIKEHLKEYWQRYDTYSDDPTCYYRKVARENDFELVGWYELVNIEDNIQIELKDLKQRKDITRLPKLLLLSWDIETFDIRGPGYFPLGKNETSHVYMIQVDLYWIYDSKPLKRYCLTTIPINKELFMQKYSEKISVKEVDYTFKEFSSEIELLIGFAEIFSDYDPDIEIGYNTGGYDWNFMLEKAEKLDILNIFISILILQTVKREELLYHIRETDIRVVEKDLEEKMSKYEFSGMNIKYNVRSKDIKTNPMENMKCIYVNKPGTLFIDLLAWARKTFPTEIKNTLDEVLKRCGLEG